MADERKALAGRLRIVANGSLIPKIVRAVVRQAVAFIDPDWATDWTPEERHRQSQEAPRVGRYYRHTKRGVLVKVLSVTAWDTTLDCPAVRYVHCDEDGNPEPVTIGKQIVEEFTRPIFLHPNAWTVRNDDGTPRFYERSN